MKLWNIYCPAKIERKAEISKFLSRKCKKVGIDLDIFVYFLIFAVLNSEKSALQTY